jgi:hypothetical protein
LRFSYLMNLRSMLLLRCSLFWLIAGNLTPNPFP